MCVAKSLACTSKHIVYGIISKQCHIIYIGETGCRLADRISEYIRSNRSNFSAFSVAHFDPLSSCSLNDFSVTEIIHCICSNGNRLNIENRIIHKLGTLFNFGLTNVLHIFLYVRFKLRHCLSLV